MKSSFPSILVAVLSGQPGIAELPKLIASDCEGEFLEGEVPWDLLLKIARLQTLCAKAHENTEPNSFEAIKQIAEETNVRFVEAGTNSAMVNEDATHREMMLERLIVEVVREAFPAECGQFGVRYAVNLSGKIVRLPINKRFNDSTW